MATKHNPFSRASVLITAAALLAACLLALAEKPAQATFPGSNGKIAFVSDRDSIPGEPVNDDIYVTDENGSSPIRLTSDPALDQFPAVSPNGKEIAFVSTRSDAANPNSEGDYEVYVMDAKDDDGDGQGDNLRRLTDDASDVTTLAWSPDGKMLAFTGFQDGDGDVYVMPADGSEPPKNLTQEAPGATTYFDGQPVWSPDGNKLAFMSQRKAADGTTDSEIYTMNATDGSSLTQLTNNTAVGDSMPDYSPNSNRIAFARTAFGDIEVYVMDAKDGSGQTDLTNDPAAFERWPAWSPDGTKIAFWRNGFNDGEIYIMNADGSNQTNLTNNPAGDIEPDWGPAPQKSK